MPLFVVLGAVFGTPFETGRWPVTGMILAWTVFAVAGYYLMIRASIDLVAAERGFGGGTGRKVGTFLLFFFWIFGAFFIQARVRRLVQRFAAGEAVPLPMETLAFLVPETGRPSLILTEAVAEADFKAYGEELIGRLDGHIAKRGGKEDALCREVEIEGSNYRLIFDPAASRISLTPDDDSAELLLVKLQKWLAPAKTEP